MKQLLLIWLVAIALPPTLPKQTTSKPIPIGSIGPPKPVKISLDWAPGDTNKYTRIYTSTNGIDWSLYYEVLNTPNASNITIDCSLIGANLFQGTSVRIIRSMSADGSMFTNGYQQESITINYERR